jgi:hypothetical protein
VGWYFRRFALADNYIAYALKISKQDFHRTLFGVSPPWEEAIQTVLINFLPDLMIPFDALRFFIFGGALQRDQHLNDLPSPWDLAVVLKLLEEMYSNYRRPC